MMVSSPQLDGKKKTRFQAYCNRSTGCYRKSCSYLFFSFLRDFNFRAVMINIVGGLEDDVKALIK